MGGGKQRLNSYGGYDTPIVFLVLKIHGCGIIMYIWVYNQYKDDPSMVSSARNDMTYNQKQCFKC
jgi:hypothetical protein